MKILLKSLMVFIAVASVSALNILVANAEPYPPEWMREGLRWKTDEASGPFNNAPGVFAPGTDDLLKAKINLIEDKLENLHKRLQKLESK